MRFNKLEKAEQRLKKYILDVQSTNPTEEQASQAMKDLDTIARAKRALRRSIILSLLKSFLNFENLPKKINDLKYGPSEILQTLLDKLA